LITAIFISGLQLLALSYLQDTCRQLSWHFSFIISAGKSFKKEHSKKINALVTPRKVLVVLQFWFAIILIICTIIVKQQIDYAQDRKTGYDKNNLVYSFLRTILSRTIRF